MQDRLGVCATEVFLDGQGTLAGNARRIEAARRIIEAHTWGAVQLVGFPAGFLRAETEKTVREHAAPLVDLARRAGLAVLFGVDSEPLKAMSSSRVREGTLPSFLIGWAPGMEDFEVWRQRVRSRNDASAPVDVRPRVLRVGRFDVAPLIGGEIFHDGIRDALVPARPEVVMLCAHLSAGSKHWAGQEALRSRGLCSVRSVHSATPVTQCLCAPRGYRLSNMAMKEADVFAFTYVIDDEDKGLEELVREHVPL